MMRAIRQHDLKSQRGAVTLLTALVLLISITLITMSTSKTVLVETQIAADNYRTVQAVAAANYALDFGFNYFNNGRFVDIVNNVTGVAGSDTFPDPVSVPNLVLDTGYGTQTTTATVIFDNHTNRCGAPATVNMKSGLITATGFSDDRLASRTISQCVGPLQLLRDNGSDQPLIVQGSMTATGSAKIINRYTNTNIWSGGSVKLGVNSNAIETYIKDPERTTPLSTSELLNTDSTQITQLVSNLNLGNGLDIIDNDPNLGMLVGLNFFKNYFTVDSREQLKQKAIDANQYYTSFASAEGKSGLIWIEGEQAVTSNATYGTAIPAAPAVIIVNGNLNLNGGPNINGLLYVAGKFSGSATASVVGAVVVEGTDLTTGLQATAPLVSTTGGFTLVYWQGFVSASTSLLPGFGTVISGSWRDW